MGWNDHIDDGRGPSPIDGIIAMLKKEGWIEDKTFIPWTGTDGSQDGVCRFTKAGEGHDVEIIRYYPKSESSYYEAVSVPKIRYSVWTDIGKYRSRDSQITFSVIHGWLAFGNLARKY